MKSIFIEPTVKTPTIDLNHLTGELILSGKSIPENAAELYERPMSWVLEYIKQPRHTTNLRFNLEYFNTSSSIWLSKIVKALCSIKESKFTLIIHLYFFIEEFDNMDIEDLKDTLSPIIDMIGTPSISLGIRIYGTDEKGEVLRESMDLI